MEDPLAKVNSLRRGADAAWARAAAARTGQESSEEGQYAERLERLWAEEAARVGIAVAAGPGLRPQTRTRPRTGGAR